ncbi:MAG: hypothetical protein EOM31_13920, partial [Bacteroidia bacterium]|nr:hypothetical protein [Bacteroidia bacterium]
MLKEWLVNLTVSEALAKQETFKLYDGFSLTDKLAKTSTVHWYDLFNIDETAGKHTTRPVTESFAVTDKMVRQFTKNNIEGLHIADKVAKGLIYHIYENITASESYLDHINFNLRVFETLGINEVLGKQTTKPLAESFALIDKSAKALSKFINEGFAASDSLKRQSKLVIKESLALTDEIKRNLAIALHEQIAFIELLKKSTVIPQSEYMQMVDDGLHKSMTLVEHEAIAIIDKLQQGTTKRASETIYVQDSIKRSQVLRMAELLGIAESYVDNINFCIRVMENLHVGEIGGKHTTRPLRESFGITDRMTKGVGKKFNDGLAVADFIDSTSTFILHLNEGLHVADKAAKHVIFIQSEGCEIMDGYYKRANAVYGDIAILNKAITLEDFNAINMPQGYAPFKDFLTGEFNFRKALIRLTLQAGITSARPYVSDWKVNVDVPD